ncbi:hypothetical protein QZH41_000568 [Actinostola sp. cb2023]|nr:hypothetical protein QZH41_000568 [Actinostola sp. cb2023]
MITYAKNNPNEGYRKVAVQFGISRTQAQKILKAILAQYKSNMHSSKKKRDRSAKYLDVHEALWEWYTLCRGSNIPVDEWINASEIVKSINVSMAIEWGKQAWSEVSPETIVKCFKKRKLYPQEVEEEHDPFEEDSIAIIAVCTRCIDDANPNWRNDLRLQILDDKDVPIRKKRDRTNDMEHDDGTNDMNMMMGWTQSSINLLSRAKVNVAAPGTRKVQQKAAESEFTCEPGLQWEALKQLKEANPKGRFWLKADACDIKAVLQQSTRKDANGNPITAIVDETIPKNVIQDLHNMNVNNGFSMEDAVTFIRGRLVPPGYQAHPFRTNTPESYLDKLRSLVATYRYRHSVKLLKEGGIDFSLYVYIPETDPTTGDGFHEREDHCHILKRIWKHTREGGPDDIDVTAFDEAMRDPNTGLTHAALTGEPKQSVVDAERMLSILVGRYLRDHGHDREAEYGYTVAGWHEAAMTSFIPLKNSWNLA